MFKTVNAYDEVVAKATDEKQTVENWDILLTVWDKVNEDGEAGARNCVAALLKRLQHRSATVQLFSLTLAGALVNNCGSSFHKELNGKAFTGTLVRLVNDNTTHAEVKKRILKLIDEWVKEFGKNPDFDPMVDVHSELAKTHSFDDDRAGEPVRGGPSAEDLRREEEELQRVLAMSAADADPLRGFQKSQPSAAPGGHTSSGALGGGEFGTIGGYRKALPQQPQGHSPLESTFTPPATSSVIHPPPTEVRKEEMPKRVKALYDFSNQGGEELDFKQGEVLNIVERVDASWWRGELRGKVGIFPTNYVEELPNLPEPSRASPPPTGALSTSTSVRGTNLSPGPGAGSIDQTDIEAQVFAQAGSIDQLLQMMRTVDVQNENVAENEELLELYQQSMAIRPKVVKLIEKYNQKQADLRAINEKFTRAKQTYDAMVEESTQRFNQQQAEQASLAAQGYYQGQQYQQQQQPPAGAYGQQQYGATPQPDPSIEQQRIEYERQLAQYHIAMEQYNAQQAAAAQQYYAQQAQAQAQAQAQQQPQHQQQSVPAALPVAGAVAAATGVAALASAYPQAAATAAPEQAKSPDGQHPGQNVMSPPLQDAHAYAQGQPVAPGQVPALDAAPATAAAQPAATALAGPSATVDPSGYQWDGQQWVWVGFPPTAVDTAAAAVVPASSQVAAPPLDQAKAASPPPQSTASSYPLQSHLPTHDLVSPPPTSAQAGYPDQLGSIPQSAYPSQPSYQLSDQMSTMSLNSNPAAQPPSGNPHHPPLPTIPSQQQQQHESTPTAYPSAAVRAQSPPMAASLPPTEHQYVDPYSMNYSQPQYQSFPPPDQRYQGTAADLR